MRKPAMPWSMWICPQQRAVKVQAGACKPGMFARGEFELGQSSTLTVLQSAVLVRDRLHGAMRVGAGWRVSRFKVATGRVLGDQVDSIAGRQPADRLVASDAGLLSQGDVVHVVAGIKEKNQPTHTPSVQDVIYLGAF